MFRKIVVTGLALLLLAVAAIPLSPPSLAQEAGQDPTPNFIFINHIGQDLYLDLDDHPYIVPGTATAPDGGRLTLYLVPGQHKFAANVPGLPLGTAGDFTLVAGATVAKSAFIDRTPPTVENGILIDGPREFVNVIDFDPFAPPPPEPQPVVDTWQPAPPGPGQGSLVWINTIGTDELTVDLNGRLYKVPPQTNDRPGRHQLDLPPGRYTYTASVPNGSTNGQIDLVAGQVLGVEVYAEIIEPVIYDVGDQFDFLPEITLKVNRLDITAQTAPPTEATAAPTAPAPTTAETAPPAEVAPPAVAETSPPEGLLIKNFTGDTLIFTINNAVYTVEAGTETFTLPLPPGQYNFTASLPAVARNDTVILAPGQTVLLSIATDIAHDVLNVYQN